MDLSMATCNAERVAMKSSEYRKVIKPLLERRRRARINNCLDELKALILETAQPENTDASKLEKADILELTVQHLRNLRHRTWRSPPSAAKHDAADKFRAGFAECAHEVSSFVSALSGVDGDIKSRLVSHLAHCINRIPTTVAAASSSRPQHPSVPVPQEQQVLCRIPVSTPTPPPSPVSPMTTCGTPTSAMSIVPDYVVPVSPISPAADTNMHRHHHSPYAIPSTYIRSSYYVWPSEAQRSISRASSIDTPSDEGYSDREDAVPLCRPVTKVGAEEKPCWRPW